MKSLFEGLNRELDRAEKIKAKLVTAQGKPG